MVQKLSYTANSITLGTGTSKVVLGADSGNLIVKDSDANTSIIEPGWCTRWCRYNLCKLFSATILTYISSW